MAKRPRPGGWARALIALVACPVAMAGLARPAIAADPSAAAPSFPADPQPAATVTVLAQSIADAGRSAQVKIRVTNTGNVSLLVQKLRLTSPLGSRKAHGGDCWSGGLLPGATGEWYCGVSVDDAITCDPPMTLTVSPQWGPHLALDRYPIPDDLESFDVEAAFTLDVADVGACDGLDPPPPMVPANLSMTLAPSTARPGNAVAIRNITPYCDDEYLHVTLYRREATYDEGGYPHFDERIGSAGVSDRTFVVPDVPRGRYVVYLGCADLEADYAQLVHTRLTVTGAAPATDTIDGVTRPVRADAAGIVAFLAVLAGLLMLWRTRSRPIATRRSKDNSDDRGGARSA